MTQKLADADVALNNMEDATQEAIEATTATQTATSEFIRRAEVQLAAAIADNDSETQQAITQMQQTNSAQVAEAVSRANAAKTATEAATAECVEATNDAKHPPYFDRYDGYWRVWNAEMNQYEITDLSAMIPTTFPRFDCDPETMAVYIESAPTDAGRFELAEDGCLYVNF